MYFIVCCTPPFPIIVYPALHTFLLPSRSLDTFRIVTPGSRKRDIGGRRQNGRNIGPELGIGKSHVGEGVWGGTTIYRPGWFRPRGHVRK